MKLLTLHIISLFLVGIFTLSTARGIGIPPSSKRESNVVVTKGAKTNPHNHIEPQFAFASGESSEELPEDVLLPYYNSLRQMDGGTAKPWTRIYFPDNLPGGKPRRKLRRMRKRMRMKGKSCPDFRQCLFEHALQIEDPDPVRRNQFPVDESPITFLKKDGHDLLHMDD